jgi:hypothetical protein
VVANPDPANTPVGVTFDSSFFGFEVEDLTLEKPAGGTLTSHLNFQTCAFFRLT